MINLHIDTLFSCLISRNHHCSSVHGKCPFTHVHLPWHPFVMSHAHFLQSSGNVLQTGAYPLVANSNQPHAVGDGSVGVAIRHWFHT